jgi:sugar (pentulose or hexulose) kinase
MSTIAGKLKFPAGDPQLRVTATGTTYGVAQAKGTATDLVVVIVAGGDGANAVAGSTAVAIQGANTTVSSSTTWTAVVPDKGTLAAITASGQQVVHIAQELSSYYRVQLIAATTATANVEVVWIQHPVEDSFDASVQ